MKLSQLLEMPDFGDKEMVTVSNSAIGSYSFDTVNREFEIIAKVKITNNEYWVILKKDKSFVVIGYLGNRRPGEPGLRIIGRLDLKEHLDLSFFNEINIETTNAIQVDGVEVFDNNKMNGVGTTLYFALAQYGYVLISDTFQYRGGKALWKKIARVAKAEKCSVYIIEEGVPLMKKGKLVNYNGSNIPDSQLWSSTDQQIEDRKKHTLFVLKKK